MFKMTSLASCIRKQIPLSVVAGGAGKNCMDLATVELYDPREGSWRAGPSLRQGRRGFGLVSIDVSRITIPISSYLCTISFFISAISFSQSALLSQDSAAGSSCPGCILVLIWIISIG